MCTAQLPRLLTHRLGSRYAAHFTVNPGRGHQILTCALRFGGTAKTTLGAALNGTDAIGGFPNLFGAALGALVQNGTVPEALLDDKIIRILTPFLALDQASLPKIDFDRWVANATSERVAREVTEGAITLLKNTNEPSRGLPLKGVRDIARESASHFCRCKYRADILR